MRALATAVLISWLAVTPAQAQGAWAQITADVIGQTISRENAMAGEQGCLSGPTSFSDEAMASARDGVMRGMRSYVTSASASSSANVSRSFSGNHRRQIWVADDQPGNVQSVSDPLAQRLISNGVANVPTPDAFIRSGDGATAEALWLSRDPSDASHVVGSYSARFQHELFRGWVLTRLRISTRAEAPQAPASYCHEDGDIAPIPKKPQDASPASDAQSTEAREQSSQSSPATSTPQ